MSEVKYSAKKRTFKGTSYDDIINASNVDTFPKGFKIYGGKGNDIITGSNYNDKIVAGSGSDVIFGLSGNDKIYTGADSDVVYGGVGNDLLYGQSGINTFYFKSGDGNDKLYIGKGRNVLVFDNNLSYSDLTYEKVKNNLVINYGNSDSVTIVNYFKSKHKYVDEIVFYDYESAVSDPLGSTYYLSDNVLTKGYYDYYDFYYNSDSENYITRKCQVLDGSGYNDLIVSSKKYDIINSYSGDDTIYTRSKLASVDGGSGNDKYIVSSLKHSTMIYDNAGIDKICINSKSSNTNIIFEVTNTGDHGENYLFVVNDATLKKLIKTKNTNISKGIQIYNYFSSGCVEYIQTKNGTITSNSVEAVTNSVKYWLQRNNYSSAIEALMYSSKTKRNELINLYKGIWNYATYNSKSYVSNTNTESNQIDVNYLSILNEDMISWQQNDSNIEYNDLTDASNMDIQSLVLNTNDTYDNVK